MTAEQLDVVVWDGTVDEPGRLAFAGERARTLIVASGQPESVEIMPF